MAWSVLFLLAGSHSRHLRQALNRAAKGPVTLHHCPASPTPLKIPVPVPRTSFCEAAHPVSAAPVSRLKLTHSTLWNLFALVSASNSNVPTSCSVLPLLPLPHPIIGTLGLTLAFRLSAFACLRLLSLCLSLCQDLSSYSSSLLLYVPGSKKAYSVQVFFVQRPAFVRPGQPALLFWIDTFLDRRLAGKPQTLMF